MAEPTPSAEGTDNIVNPPRWQRFLYMVLYAVVADLLLWLVVFLALVQFLLVLFTSRANRNLRDFAARLNAYFRDILAFLSYNSETVPFPFSPFPSRGNQAR